MEGYLVAFTMFHESFMDSSVLEKLVNYCCKASLYLKRGHISSTSQIPEVQIWFVQIQVTWKENPRKESDMSSGQCWWLQQQKLGDHKNINLNLNMNMLLKCWMSSLWSLQVCASVLFSWTCGMVHVCRWLSCSCFLLALTWFHFTLNSFVYLNLWLVSGVQCVTSSPDRAFRLSSDFSLVSLLSCFLVRAFWITFVAHLTLACFLFLSLPLPSHFGICLPTPLTKPFTYCLRLNRIS